MIELRDLEAGLDDDQIQEYEELKKKADLHDQLIKILIQHCGEDGDNEGAVKTLNRIIEKAEKWDKFVEDVEARE